MAAQKNQIFLLSPYADKAYHSPLSSLNFIKFYLEDSGFQAEVIDCSHYDSEYQQVLSILKKSTTPVIGITAYTRLRFQAYKLIRLIRNEIPGSTVVVGGHHFGFLAEETLTELPEVDIVVRGEGEITFKEICEALETNLPIDNILGISFKRDYQIIHNADRPLEMNLDKFRNFDFKEIEKYIVTSKVKTDKRHKYFTVSASRGCPNSCVFCSLGAEKVRFRSIDKIIDEIKAKVESSGTRYVSFTDSSLTLRESFLRELCEKIIDQKLDIKFNCYSRVNIKTDLLKLMKQAGLVSMEIALESGSPKVLKSVKKNITVEQFEEFCIKAHGLGIKLFVFCLISLPDETIEDVDKTIALIKKMAKYIHSAGIQSTRIMPDAALFNIARQRGILPMDFSWFQSYVRESDGEAHKIYDTVPLYLEHLSKEEIRCKIDEFNNQLLSVNDVVALFKNNLDINHLKKLSFSEISTKAHNALFTLKKVVQNSFAK